MALSKTTPKYVKRESGMTPRLDTDAASNNTSQIKSKPANGGVIRAKRRRNIGASHAASGIVPLPKHRVANTPPIASHTNGVIWRMSAAPPLRRDDDTQMIRGLLLEHKTLLLIAGLQA